MTNDQGDAVQLRVAECPSGQVIAKLVTGLSRVDNRKNASLLLRARRANDGNSLLEASIPPARWFSQFFA